MASDHCWSLFKFRLGIHRTLSLLFSCYVRIVTTGSRVDMARDNNCTKGTISLRGTTMEKYFALRKLIRKPY